MKFEVVCTKKYLDVGLFISSSEIRARCSEYNRKARYGGSHTMWIGTGVFLTEDEWDKITYNKTTDEILNELHIKKDGIVMTKRTINDVEVNEESIITALKIIKQVCEDNRSDHTKCPFSVGGDKKFSCGITDLEPDNWNILEYKKFQALG